MNARRLLALLLGFAAARAAEPPASVPAPDGAPAPAAVTSPASAPAQPPLAPRKSRGPDPRTSAAQPPPPLSPRFQQVRDRMEELFRHRSEAPPVFEARSNPFRAAGALAPLPQRGPKPAAADAPPPVASATDLQLLQQAAATLKVGGTIRIGGVDHLSINQTAYKEGDAINVRVKGQPVVVRVKNISRYSYTLSLNGTELSVKY